MAASGESIFFKSGALRLEGRLRLAPGPDAVVISHPHPLYGGELDNPVVVTLAKVYQRLGYSTLRFNFRGVGASEGAYDNGRGEQDDLRAAADVLVGLGKTVTDLTGYSFGAWITLSLDPPLPAVRRLVLVAPPVAYMEFDTLPPSPAAELVVISGDCDSFAPLDLLRKQIPFWHPSGRLHVLPGADHFYQDALGRLANLMEAVLTGTLGREGLQSPDA
ncbi:MAG TPA: alpha/beta hydrolase [Candidatus Competibacteraceae bacterium]|nr:alpha/beta hydrolase [Candidatus Competibacteraceae bacterium]MCP5133300.1 alpha/beta hydrolase [Gammaproteobacteria bacterium]HPF57287.1 alpha/beta hydrolase [Candidatus Competibacteraceae bacterium]HRY17898.1 alpha/beta hydrolase [Candidatus Competibacteraceae bacterium]